MSHYTPRALVLFALILTLLLGGFAQSYVTAQGPDTGPYTQQARLGRGLVRSVAWSPNGDLVAVGGALGVWVYTPEFEDVWLLQGHTKAIYDIAFSPDGTKIATVSHDMTVRTWDVRDSDPLHVLEGHTDLIVAVDWHPSADLIASGSYDGTIRLWNPVNGVEVAVLTGHTDWVSDVMFSRDRLLLASASYDGTIRIWDIAPDSPTFGETVAVLEGHAGPVTALDWHGDMLVSAGFDRSVRGWNPFEGTQIWIIEDAHDDVIYDVDWNPQGYTVGTASWDGTVREWLWYAEDASPVIDYAAHTGRVQRVVWNPVGTRMATLGWDDTVRITDMTPGSPTIAQQEHMDYIVWLGWTAEGVTALTLDGRLVTFDAASGGLISAEPADPANRPPVSQTNDAGRAFAIDGGGTVRIMESADDDAAIIATLPGRANAAVWSPDGTQLAVAVRNGTITIWGTE